MGWARLVLTVLLKIGSGANCVVAKLEGLEISKALP